MDITLRKQLKKYNRISNNISKCCLNYRSPQEVLEDYLAVMWAADFACFEEPRRRKIRKIFDKSTYIIFFLRKVSPIIDDCTPVFAGNANCLLKFIKMCAIIKTISRCDGIGRRDGFKIRWWQHRVGSSPTTGTISSVHKGFHFMNTRFSFFLIRFYVGAGF